MTICNYRAEHAWALRIHFGRTPAPAGADGMIGICTDSHSLLSPELIERFLIEVVPLTINIGEIEYLDGVDIDIDEYYAMTAASAAGPETAPTQPSSGQFALAYDRLADRGVDQILSIHTSLGVNGTLTSARLATRCSSVPVKVLDTYSPSVALSCAIWAAADAASKGAALCEVIAATERVATAVGNLFVYEASEVCRPATLAGDEQIALMTLIGDEVRVVRHVDRCSDVAQAMAACLSTTSRPVNVLLAHADRCGATMMDDVRRLISGIPNVAEVAQCRIGPSIAAYLGHCGAGIFFYPIG